MDSLSARNLHTFITVRVFTCVCVCVCVYVRAWLCVHVCRGGWPWQAAIRLRGSRGDGRLVCGATLIDTCWVLTSAHCFKRSVTHADMTSIKMCHSLKGYVKKKFKPVPTAGSVWDPRPKQNNSYSHLQTCIRFCSKVYNVL